MTVTYEYKHTVEDPQSITVSDLQRDSLRLQENESAVLSGGGVARVFIDVDSADEDYPTKLIASWQPGTYLGAPNVRMRVAMRTFQVRLVDDEVDSIRPLEVGYFINTPGVAVADPAGLVNLLFTVARTSLDVGVGVDPMIRLAAANISDMFS